VRSKQNFPAHQKYIICTA